MKFYHARRTFNEQEYNRLDVTPNGIRYWCELDGPQGANYTLVAINESQTELITAARYLRINYDVIGAIRLYRIDKR